VNPIAGALGAEVAGVHLGQIDDDVFSEVRAAFVEHQVLFFRDQEITRDQHKAFARRFGTLQIHPYLQPLKDQGHPEFVVLQSDEQHPYLAEAWHSDVTFVNEPPLGSVLRCVVAPEFGGDTMWASMYAAYEALSDRMKTYLEGLTAVHDGEHYRGQYANYGIADKPSYPRAEHPVVRTHPATGKKALYVNKGFTRRILGIPRDESDGMLRYIYEHMANPLFQCRFHWAENSIAFWDNRCVQHHAMWDYWPHTRSGNRVTVKGERPV